MVKPGDVVRVKVLEVDKDRKRIALTMRLDYTAEQRSDFSKRRGAPGRARAALRTPASRREPRAVIRRSSRGRR